ncbi:MAG: alpha/beta fold hydrolase [Acidimicrobiales bacterium]|nr:alpha/beta fold hydrolase [Acidimicrobiales bacterium]
MGATRGRWRSCVWLAAAVAASVAAGCGGSTSGSGGGTGTSATDQSKPVSLPALPPAGAVAWAACSAGSTLSCGTVSVPVDYRHPTLASIPLAVIRSRATDPSGPTGTLVFNPGGPGQSGTQILPVTLGDFPPAVRQHFDIVSFDPRGTGASDPLRCGTAPSALTSVAPVPSAAGQPLPGAPAFTAMARRCQHRTASLEPFLNTFNTARDMDRIRQALGLASIDFYGISYGTVLGSVYADLFPRRVGTMVLDGAVDVNAPLIQQATQEAPAAERSLDHLLAGCAAQSTCPLGADPQAFFRSLASALIHSPLPPPGGADPYPVTVGDLDTATLLVLSVPAFSSNFYAALVAANGGNGAPLRSLALLFVTDIDGSPLVDPLWAITCNDADAHPGPTEGGSFGPVGRRPLPVDRRLCRDLHDGRVCLLALRPRAGSRPPSAGHAADPRHRQHGRPQYALDQCPAPGHHLL